MENSSEKKPEFPAVCDSAAPEKSARELFEEITVLNGEVTEIVNGLKQNPKILEFAETAEAAGAFGVMGLLPKVFGLLPELAPALSAFKKMVAIGEKQHQLTGKLIDLVGE